MAPEEAIIRGEMFLNGSLLSRHHDFIFNRLSSGIESENQTRFVRATSRQTELSHLSFKFRKIVRHPGFPFTS